MTRSLLVSALISMAVSMGAGAQPDAWAPLRVFAGQWQGTISGTPGTQFSRREYHFELNDTFLSQRDHSVFEPKSPRATPDVRDDFGFFSYDKNLQKIVWRQFHSEGFVNEYTLDSISADGHVLEFVTVRIETTEWAGRGRISGAFVDEPHAPRRGRLKNGNPPGDVSKAAVWS